MSVKSPACKGQHWRGKKTGVNQTESSGDALRTAITSSESAGATGRTSPLGHNSTGTDLLTRAPSGKKTFTSVSKLGQWARRGGKALFSFIFKALGSFGFYSSHNYRRNARRSRFSIRHATHFHLDVLSRFIYLLYSNLYVFLWLQRLSVLWWSLPAKAFHTIVTSADCKHLGSGIQCTHHTSSLHPTGWFSSCRREGRWRAPPGSSARCPGSTRPRRPRQWPCPRFPRPAHLLGYRWRSTRWTQWWRLPLGPTPSPKIKGSVGHLWNRDASSCSAVFFSISYWFELCGKCSS